MSYVKKTWVTGEVVYPSDLNNMENGIAANDSAVTELTEEMSAKANTDGYYEDLTAGLSDNLTTKLGITDECPYNFRATGSGNAELEVGTRADLKKIVGVSVGWNQLFPTKTVNYTAANLTITSANDGKFVVTVTSDVNAETGNITEIGGGAFTPNHVYAWLGKDSSGKVSARLKAYSKVTDTVFKPSTASYNNISFMFDNAPAGTYTMYLRLHDLTLALGSTIADYVYSLEQATAGAGVAWLKQHFSKMFGSYQPYDAGSIKSVTGLSAHVMRNADEEIIGSYALDDSLTLRGTLKIDASGNLSADGDTYEADGTVTRNYAERAYQAGDESLPDAITNGTTTVYKLITPTTETAEPYTESQIVDGAGTEEFVSTSIVPVGNETFYLADLKGKLEDLPTIPEAPTTNGTYVLKATVSGGVPTYAWVSE